MDAYGYARGPIRGECIAEIEADVEQGGAECLNLAVRPEGADHQWRKIPPGELSIDPEADERLVRATARVGAS